MAQQPQVVECAKRTLAVLVGLGLCFSRGLFPMCVDVARAFSAAGVGVRYAP